MVTINDSTIRQNVWKTIYDALVAANLESSTTLITSAFVDNTPSFPQVVINPVDVSHSEPTIDSTMSYSTKEITITIDLFTKKASQIDTLADAIDNLLRTTHFDGVTLIGVGSGGGSMVDPNNNKIHALSLTFVFKRR